MPNFDPSATTPGLANPEKKDPDTVNMRCRNAQNCDGIEATEIKIGGAEHAGQRVYRCVKCGHTWSLMVGGHLSI